MELLKTANDAAWSQLLGFFGGLYDNVLFNILEMTAVYFILIVCLRIFIFKKKTAFSFVDFGYVLSVAYMVERLPMIHHRIHLALSTVSGIILQSSSYSDAFFHTTGIEAKSSKVIAEYLYYCTDQSTLLQTEPADMYLHLFRTLDQTRGMSFLGEVHQNCFGKWNVLFIITVAVMVIMFLIAITRINKKEILWYCIQAAFILYIAGRNNGALICALILWVLESSVMEIMFPEEEGTDTRADIREEGRP